PWLDSQIANTDRYVQTVAPLARNPAVQDAVTNRVTTKVVSYIDTAKVTDALKRALQKTGTPPAVVDKADLLAGALKSGATSAVHAVVNKVVTSDQFADVWN